MSKLSHAAGSNVVKKTVYDKVVTNLNTIDASESVLKMQYNTSKSYLEKKIDDADYWFSYYWCNNFS